MLPGITGLWQVSGRSETSYETRVQMVHRYATKWSIWLDMWILAKTPNVETWSQLIGYFLANFS